VSVEIQVELQSQSGIVRLSGEFTAETSPQVRQSIVLLCQKELPVIVIDMSQVSYVDSAGLGTLIERHNAIVAYDGKLVLCGVQEHIRRLFDLTGISKLFVMIDEVPA